MSSRAVEGEALGVLWGSRTLRNDDGSIVYDAYGFPEQDQLEGVIGDPNPDWQGGLSNTLKYKTLGYLYWRKPIKVLIFMQEQNL